MKKEQNGCSPQALWVVTTCFIIYDYTKLNHSIFQIVTRGQVLSFDSYATYPFDLS